MVTAVGCITVNGNPSRVGGYFEPSPWPTIHVVMTHARSSIKMVLRYTTTEQKKVKLCSQNKPQRLSITHVYALDHAIHNVNEQTLLAQQSSKTNNINKYKKKKKNSNVSL